MGKVGLAGEQAGERDVFVQRLPVEATGADSELPTLLRCGVQQPRKPSQRDTQHATVTEGDPHVAGVEVDGGGSSL
jgi:hypothetical protein